MNDFKITSSVKNYVTLIIEYHYKTSNKKLLSLKQEFFLMFCLHMMIFTNSINWEKFQRFSFGKYKAKALSYMFQRSKIPLKKIYILGINLLIDYYKITNGYLLFDDTCRQRGKVIKMIANVFKYFDTKTNGYFNAQNIVFLFLVTKYITIPVGFRFYIPCPKTKEWFEKDKEIRNLNKQGYRNLDGSKLKRPVKPDRSIEHPSKNMIAEELLKKFKELFPNIEVISFSFDSGYCSGDSLIAYEKVLPKSVVVTEVPCSIKVSDKRRSARIDEYFNSIPSQKGRMKIRGYEEKHVEIKHARLYVPSHNRRLNIVAIKYECEKNFRYLITSNFGYRPIDIAQMYSFRWLAEVFFFDWKCYEAWGQTAMQQKNAGALCGVLMSLLLDQCFLFHPEQVRRIKNNIPACTVGSLREKIIIDQHLEHIKHLLQSENPSEKIQEYAKSIDKSFVYRDSKKHMTGREFPIFKPDPYLLKKYAA